MMMDSHHKFSTKEIEMIRSRLLSFYDANKRQMPWRKLASTLEDDDERRAYSVWVSEVMLQQTQVATVVDYYNRWMKKWPTLRLLSEANLEEVNEMWSGLGYYSRGRRLHEGAQKVMQTGGKMPRNAKDLMTNLPGVGRYTAGAIASIAYNEVTGVVDGNVIRVLTRLRMIGADCTSPHVLDLIWNFANELVDMHRPGDFNQAIMELGATVCTPKSPACQQCPLSDFCKAYHRTLQCDEKTQSRVAALPKKKTDAPDVQLTDLEDVAGCKYCLTCEDPWNANQGVMNYPRKKKKKPPKEERYITLVIENEKKFLLSKRPEKGLLAGLWEFPMIAENPDTEHKTLINQFLRERLSTDASFEFNSLGMVTHIFSHIHHFYSVYHVTTTHLRHDSRDVNLTWLNKDEISTAAISTAVRKVFRLYEGASKNKNGLKRTRDGVPKSGRQKTLDGMFKKLQKT